MRTRHWLLLVSAALFVSGIGFLLASARIARRAAPPVAVEGPPTTPVASVKQLMQGIVGPAATVVFESVSTTVSSKGVEEKAPKDDAGWQVVVNSAAALAESGNLMMLGSRAIDKDDWIKTSRALREASVVAMKAAEAKDVEGLLFAGENINAACDSCHQKYQR
jgi:hypothetical protein